MLNIYILLNWFYVFLYWITTIFIIIRIILKRRSIISLLGWFWIIYIIPFFGIITYLFFGELYLEKSRIIKTKNIKPLFNLWLEKFKKFEHIFCNKNSTVADRLFKLCRNRQGFNGLKGNKIQLLSNYQDSLSTIIKNINSALYNIEMVFYVWKPGGLVDKVTEALINAAKRGIKCRIMIDSAGSWSFFCTHYPRKMREAGIELIESLKVDFFCIFSRRIDLRQHRKIIIIDNYISYVGSMNMVDPRFFKKKSNVGEWVDIFIKIEGPASVILGVVYAFDWKMETNQHILPSISNSILFKPGIHSLIQIIASGPGFPKELIKQSLITAIFSAKKQIIFTTPYLVPSDDLIQAICIAAMRSVEVLIIIPNKNNSFLVRWASRVFYSRLLKSGVKIYQFTGGLLHTKSISIDGELSLVGSVNLDMRSLWLNFEITVLIDDKSFSKKLILLQYEYISHSTPLFLNSWKKRPKWNKIIECLCYLFSPLL